ncbi:ArgE/DapE family deacylase [Candidatus Bipolaricaulota bacterium]|nr:ArgE/DapE family deacylase [Candidatus Bipolaricaulota bacterium]
MRGREAIKSWNCEHEVTTVCSDLIRFPSENPPGDVAEIATYILEYLQRAGIPARQISSVPGMRSVIAELDFGPGPCLVLNGHMDVVPAGDRTRWSFDPFGGEVCEGHVLGRGASDMKGGLASLLVAIAQAARWDTLRGKVLFTAVPDEETGGWYGTRWLLEQGFTGDACLIAEPSGTNPTIGQKGALWLRAIARGIPAHGSLSPLVGENAILRMTQIIETVYSIWERTWIFPPEPHQLIAETQSTLREEGLGVQAEALDHVTVNVGRIVGGDKVNIVADHCEAEFDLRVPIGIPVGDVFGLLRQLVEERAGSGVEIAPVRDPIEANYTSPTHPFVQLVLRIIREVAGGTSRPVLQWASSDARFFRRHGIPTLQFGPAELQGIHGYDERVAVGQLVQAARVYALLIHDYLSPGDGGGFRAA